MSLSLQQVQDEIVAHIRRQGGPQRDWYVGIASDVQKRLHGDHNVPAKNHWFIHRDAGSSNGARAIEKTLLDWGCDGGPGGGDGTTRHVYAYLKTSITIER